MMLGREGSDMPRGDGTGPMGTGPMTGRGAGYCAGYTAPGYTDPVGFGRRLAGSRRTSRGSGRGFGRFLQGALLAGSAYAAYRGYNRNRPG